ncbi:hypothetical protein I314_01772 [Cryptococcus bacillisporus CA1873]|uniref:FIT family protein scs3 n=1 Tax=Cryptococcus bacillisporus CA1873 TaxID=1296111 RepID=A0ABR5BGI2_CRYGA|nr:hypothetical protein I314_01772 [Cryptococcus bacillisporus CA1873]|eukprot:KIR68274.1 hypothetical protein I314_01772 [Cryptococcus gattii CA1873]
MYSLVHSTSLDTSEIHHHHIPERAAYFSRKSNILNVIFVKRAWAWTSALYLLRLVTSPRNSSRMPSFSASPNGGWVRRLLVWVAATACWAIFARWFFGAGLGDRIIALTGGNCALPLSPSISPILARHTFGNLFTAGPQGSSGDEKLYIALPYKFCSGIPLTPGTLPELFALLPGGDKGTAIPPGGGPTASHESLAPLPRPRWHRGFDISGHSFLLTLCIMVLGRELAPAWQAWAGGKTAGLLNGRGRGWKGKVHGLITLAATGLVGIWMWMVLMTAVYFHNPPEKLAGLLLGLLSSGLINLFIPAFSPSPFNPITTTRTSTPPSSNSGSREGDGRPLSHSFGDDGEEEGVVDENKARRGSVVNDGIIYEVEEEQDGKGEEDINVRVSVTQKKASATKEKAKEQ